MTGRLRFTTAALLGCGMLVAGGSASAATTPKHGSPVTASAPSHAPAMKHRDGSCTLVGSSNSTSPTADSGQPLLWLRSAPTQVIGVWISGLNAKHCVARRTISGGAAATRIAAAIRHSKAFPTEPLPCPFDDRTSVRLYFSYASGADEYAAVSLNGCRPISAPGRASRWGNGTAVEKALHKIAPPAWAPYLTS